MSSMIAVPGKCNTPCKYHKKGACKLGASCRFLHLNPKKRRSSPETHQLAVNKTICNQICKYGRRPFLHMVVLYASDPRVTVYAQEVLEKFLKHGIDLAVQKHLVEPNKFSTSPGYGLKKRDVRTEHLAEIICSSHADFLIVIGDRNMKNKSCQAKRKGKLMEMKVLEMITLIWKSWPQNPQKTLTRIQNLTTAQTETLLFQYCGLRHASNRVQYLETMASDIKKWQVRFPKYSDRVRPDDQTAKITNLQKCSLRLHKQLKKAFLFLDEVPVHQENPQSSRGCVMTLEYKPNSSRSPRNSISLTLKKYLQNVVLIMMKNIEDNVQSTYYDGPVWQEYFSKHMETWSVDMASLDMNLGTSSPAEASDDEGDSDFDDVQSNLSDETDALVDFDVYGDLFDSHGEGVPSGPQTDEEESDVVDKSARGPHQNENQPLPRTATSALAPSRGWYQNFSLWTTGESLEEIFHEGNRRRSSDYDQNYPPLALLPSSGSSLSSSSSEVPEGSSPTEHEDVTSRRGREEYFNRSSNQLKEAMSRLSIQQSSRDGSYSVDSRETEHTMLSESKTESLSAPAEDLGEHPCQFPVTDIAPSPISPPASTASPPPSVTSPPKPQLAASAGAPKSQHTRGTIDAVQPRVTWPLASKSSIQSRHTVTSHRAHGTNVSAASLGQPAWPSIQQTQASNSSIPHFNTTIGSPLHEKPNSVSIFDIPSPLSSPVPSRSSDMPAPLRVHFSPIIGDSIQLDSLFSEAEQEQMNAPQRRASVACTTTPFVVPPRPSPLGGNGMRRRFMSHDSYQSISRIWGDSESHPLDSPQWGNSNPTQGVVHNQTQRPRFPASF